jgi:group I intron endonuclease
MAVLLSLKSLKSYYKHREKVLARIKKYALENADKLKIKSAEYRHKVNNELGAGVYKITNHILDKYYIGCSVILANRLKTHFAKTKNTNQVSELFDDMEKYGRENFTWEILLSVDISNLSKDEALTLVEQHETEFINQYPKDKLYNSDKVEGGHWNYRKYKQTHLNYNKKKLQ